MTKRRRPRGCSEYNELSRRQFLASGMALAAAASTPAWLPRVAYAAIGGAGRDALVSIYLRGACDGLSLCPPHAEDAYYAARDTLAIPRPGSGQPGAAIDLDGFFGFAPAMRPLLDAYEAGHLLVVHACGPHDESRSHFDAQHFMEVGKPRDPDLITGWLGRHLLTIDPLVPEPLLRSIGIGVGLQQTLAGAPNTLPIADPADFRLLGAESSADDRLAALLRMYAATEDPLRTAAENTQKTIELLDSLNLDAYTPANGAVYPESDFGAALKSTAGLLKAEVGIEAIAIDRGDWDTHEEQGPIDGWMADSMGDLAGGLGAFYADVVAGGQHNVTVVVMSEFGRVVMENASRGTDHGHGTIMMVLGGAIAGGRVLADWPGLAPEDLFQGQDLDVTINYRDILAEVLRKRLDSAALEVVFPDYTPTEHGVVTG
ncbi:MAG: DUF1501 domain-containing protein [Nitrospiraceae bacterium]|nr:DUF1501 domain-containing protein [Nitrospiraceae bacterium]